MDEGTPPRAWLLNEKNHLFYKHIVGGTGDNRSGSTNNLVNLTLYNLL